MASKSNKYLHIIPETLRRNQTPLSKDELYGKIFRRSNTGGWLQEALLESTLQILYESGEISRFTDDLDTQYYCLPPTPSSTPAATAVPS